MSNLCQCGGRLGATGSSDCIIKFFTTSNFILMPTYKADGTKNFIDLSDTDPATLGATIQTLTQVATSQDERLYPLPFAENITREKTDRLTETAASGNIYNVQDGLRQNHMEFFGDNAAFSFARELQKFNCTKLSYFSVDVNGTLEGYLDESDPTKFYPFPIMDNTFYQMYMYATDTTIQKLALDFNLKRNFDETKTYYLTADDLGYPATDLVGLKPANVVVSNITTTGCTAKVTESTNSALGGDPIEGLLLAGFTLNNITAGGTVTITGVTEGAAGVYAITYAAVAGANTFELVVSATGYDVAPAEYQDPA